MSVITEVWDPSSALVAPPKADTGEYIASLRESAGSILSSIDWVAEQFFGISLIEQFVKPFAGDWPQLEFASGGWLNIAAALDASSKNLEAAAGCQLQQVWSGEASTRAGARLVDMADLHRSQAEGCRTIADQLAYIIEVSKATGELVASLLSMINDFLQDLAMKAMVPVFGAIAGGIDIARFAHKFWKWVDRMTRAIQDLIDTVSAVMRVISTIQRVFGIAAKGLDLGTKAVGAYGATYMDDTSAVQFGVG